MQHSDSDMLWCNQKVQYVCVRGLHKVQIICYKIQWLSYMVTTETDPRLSSLHGNN